MFEELRHVFTQLSHDPAIRAVVLGGSGDRAFTAGLDVHEAAEMEGGLLSMSKPSRGTENSFPDVGRIAVHLRRYVNDFQNCISSIERCEKPVVAAMHGHALGLAIDIATAADVRMCTHSTQLAVKEVDIGMAADMGTLSRLPKVVNHAGWVKEVAMTGRTFGAREALRVGLVNYAYETKAAMVQAALTLASLLASKSPIAVQGIKEILNYSRDHPVQDGMFVVLLRIDVLAENHIQASVTRIYGTALLCRPLTSR